MNNVEKDAFKNLKKYMQVKQRHRNTTNEKKKTLIVKYFSFNIYYCFFSEISNNWAFTVKLLKAYKYSCTISMYVSINVPKHAIDILNNKTIYIDILTHAHL